MAQLQVGYRLANRYRIDGLIARGGMSTVYRAFDENLARPCAAKVMDDRYLDDETSRARFSREARAMARFNQPNLVNVFDFSTSGEHVFLIMELITGGTLRELLAERGPMPPFAATAVMRSVLTGLAVAHRAGMVHRDIKPDNILINGDSQVKLTDFGLVRAVANSQVTSDQIVGTVTYLSPEQVSGGDIGPESDVYSAGVVLYELLTGAAPFEGDSPISHAYQRLHHDVPAPSEQIEGVPPVFDAIVAKACARDPHERFSDASAFLQALDRAADRLDLPGFKVPVPENAAAHRATGMIGPIAGGIAGGAAGAAAGAGAHAADAMPTAITPIPGSTSGAGADEGHASPTSRPSESEAATQIIGSHPITPETGAQHPTDGGPAGQPHSTTAAAPQHTSLLPVPGEETTAVPAPRQASPVPPAPQQQPAASPEQSNRSPVKLVLWLTIVILLTIAIAIGGWWFGSGRYGEIPQVLGLDVQQASTKIHDAGFDTRTSERYDDRVPKGQVIGTTPPFGDKLPRGHAVSLNVSLGKPTVPQPVANVDDYKKELEKRSLVWSQGQDVYSDTVPVGGIAKVSPDAGTELTTGSTVIGSLSKGPAPVKLPDLRGKSVEDATKTLDAAGIKVSGQREQFDAEVEKGKVITTDPGKDSTVDRGSGVTLIVSDAIAVPDVMGLSVDDARHRLEEAKLQLGQVTNSPEPADRADTILESYPEAGTTVDPAYPHVDVVVADRIKVPNLLGRKVSEAQAMFADRGLSLDGNRGMKPNSRIIWQSPSDREGAKPGETIKVRTFG